MLLYLSLFSCVSYILFYPLTDHFIQILSPFNFWFFQTVKQEKQFTQDTVMEWKYWGCCFFDALSPWVFQVPLPGYVEAFPNPRYPKGSPSRLPLQYNQTLEQPPAAPSTASEQSLPQVLKDMDSMPLSSLSTSALVQAIRQEVAKLAMKQNDMFEF